MNNIIQLMKFYIEAIRSLLYIKYYQYDQFPEELYESYRSNLEKLEDDFPDLIQPDSPSFTIGLITENRSLITHKKPMLSIKHTYDQQEAQKWLDKLLMHGSVIASQKLDGIAVSLHYKNGLIVNGSLRGDGTKGEDITQFLIYNQCCPVKIDILETIEVRGELCGSKNTDRAKLAGAIRSIKAKKMDNVTFYAYDYVGYPSFSKGLGILSRIFSVVPHIITDKMVDIIDNKLDSDGIVYRIDNNQTSIELGKTSRYYRGQFSYKYSKNSTSSSIVNISWSLNRTGNLIPVCHIKPIYLDQILITKVNGYNKRYLLQNNIGPDSEISVSRVGNSAPQIINVVNSSKFEPIKFCYSCGNELFECDIHYKCNNTNCKEQHYQQLSYFFKKIGIKGLGISKIKREYQSGFFETINHFYQYKWAKDHNDIKIIQLMKSMSIDKNKLIIALGIPGIAESSLKEGLSDAKLENFNKYFYKNQNHLTRMFKLFQIDT